MAEGPRPEDDHLPVPLDRVEAGETAEAAVDAWRYAITRRRFLTMAAGGVAASTAEVMSRGQLIRLARRAISVPPAQAGTSDEVPDISIHAERDLDLLLLDFAFFGFSVQPGFPPAIVPTTENNHIVVDFPPQAIGEAVYPSDDVGDFLMDPTPILSELAGPSRLVFGLRVDQRIPLPTMTVADLLAWEEWELRVHPAAQTSYIDRPDEPVDVRAPRFFETQIECPYALYLSPTDGARFASRRDPSPIADPGNPNELIEAWGAILTRDQRVVAPYARDFPGSPVGNATLPTNIDYTPIPNK